MSKYLQGAILQLPATCYQLPATVPADPHRWDSHAQKKRLRVFYVKTSLGRMRPSRRHGRQPPICWLLAYYWHILQRRPTALRLFKQPVLRTESICWLTRNFALSSAVRILGWHDVPQTQVPSVRLIRCRGPGSGSEVLHVVWLYKYR